MKGPVVCIGGSLVDETFYCYQHPIPGTSNPARLERTPGGVVRNIAHHLALLGHPVELISIFGNDGDGAWLKEQCSNAGISLKHSAFVEGTTGRFTAVLGPEGDLFVGTVVNDLEPRLNRSVLEQRTEVLKKASVIVTDTNMAPECVQWLLMFCAAEGIPCVVEPVSVPKASKLSALDLNGLFLVTPNEVEISAIQSASPEPGLDGMIRALQARGVKHIWLRQGDKGSLLISAAERFELHAPKVDVIDTTGAGDGALAGYLHGFLNDDDHARCVAYGHTLAALVLGRKGAVYLDLTTEILESELNRQYPHVLS